MPQAMTAGASRGLSIADYADFELLHVLDDHSGATTIALAELLEADTRSVGTRLAWMKRKGLIERIDKDGELGWILSRRGRSLFNGRAEGLMQIRKLSKSVAKDNVMGWVAKREWTRNL